MATIARQPFAPLDNARLQSLTSLKNRQNAVSSPSTKRKAADLVDLDNSENVDPIIFAKRAKGSPVKSACKVTKPINYILKAATPLPAARTVQQSPLSPTRPASTPRRTLQPKSPAARLNSHAPKSSPIFRPAAGRSPTRAKGPSLSSSRRHTTLFSRVEPPSFNAGDAPFSLDAALKGTIPTYTSKTPLPSKNLLGDEANGVDSGWFFDIHEDTPEQEMTNLLQHSTCVLDISSDEENERKTKREKDEGKDKENVPPMDDVSQTVASRRRLRLSADEMVVEKERVALGEMKAQEFYPEGTDETSVVLVPADEEETEKRSVKQQGIAPFAGDFSFTSDLKTAVPEKPSSIEVDTVDETADVDALIGKIEEGNGKAAVLQPIDGSGETFDLWESGSDRGEMAEAVSS